MSIVIDQRALANAVPPSVRSLCHSIRDAGFGVWCVGGAIRDTILRQLGGLAEVSGGDWDIASTATPIQITQLFPRVVPSGIRHGTVTVLLSDQAVEVTTLRGEQNYSDGRHPDSVVFVTDIVQDLARRDFTINAIAYDPYEGTIFDPFGGIDDLASRRLRAVGNPYRRFSEDGLRVLRAARFAAALGVEIETSTKAAMRPSLDSYRKVSAERIRDEWTKSLRASKSSRAFRIMREQGLLDVTAPELVQLHQCSQNRHHHYDVWEHTLGTVDRVPPKSSQLRLAALFHDIGKPSVRATSPESGDYTFHNHEISGAHITDVVMRRLKFPNDLRERVVSLVRYHLVVHDSQWTDAAVRRWIGRITPDLVNDILELARCDVAAKGLDASLQLQALAILDLRVKAILASNHALSFKDLVVTGTDLMQELGIQPGPVIGQLLRHLLEEVIEAPEHNERERLLNRSRELLKSFASVVADPSFRSRGD